MANPTATGVNELRPPEATAAHHAATTTSPDASPMPSVSPAGASASSEPGDPRHPDAEQEADALRTAAPVRSPASPQPSRRIVIASSAASDWQSGTPGAVSHRDDRHGMRRTWVLTVSLRPGRRPARACSDGPCRRRCSRCRWPSGRPSIVGRRRLRVPGSGRALAAVPTRTAGWRRWSNSAYRSSRRRSPIRSTSERHAARCGRRGQQLCVPEGGLLGWQAAIRQLGVGRELLDRRPGSSAAPGHGRPPPNSCNRPTPNSAPASSWIPQNHDQGDRETTAARRPEAKPEGGDGDGGGRRGEHRERAVEQVEGVEVAEPGAPDERAGDDEGDACRRTGRPRSTPPCGP